MSLFDLKLKKIYRTKQDNIADEFIIPALKESVTYDRGSGYFTLDSLANIADGLIPFVQHGGILRVVTSVQLNENDVETIKSGLLLQQSTVIEILHKKIEETIENEDTLLKLDFITNLIAAGILNIKIAYLPDGIYHEKIGIMTDNEGNKLYFSGSNNATVSGLNKNWETVMLLTSWEGDIEEITDQQHYFDLLWKNDIEDLEVISFPEAEKKNLIRKYKVSVDVKSAIQRIQNKTKRFVQKKKIHDYQENAIQQFLENDGNHFFEMATGTGKTFTAVKSIISLYEEKKQLSVIVVVPQIDLQMQWAKAFEEEGIKTLFLGGYANATETGRNFGAFLINVGTEKKLNVVIVTYDTFFSKIVDQCTTIGKQTIIVVDEAHNLSHKQIEQLPVGFLYRLGLSATPERYSIEETNKIVQYFTRGKIDTYKYTIDEAIKKGYLSKYMYIPVLVNLSESEFNLYQNYTKKFLWAQNQEPVDDMLIKDILTKRSSVVKKANSKLDKLEELVCDKNNGRYNFKNSVVYCGHGKDYATEGSIIDSVTRILAVKGNYLVSQFTAHTADRTRVLREFEDENYDVLVAIKCFDEGVDVPKLDKIYIMASDSLGRQTIQRRGRVLRTCTETGKKLAYIYDFIALPPISISEGIGISSLVVNEMKRAKEYARLAENKDDIMPDLISIMHMYGVSEEALNDEFDTNVE